MENSKTAMSKWQSYVNILLGVLFIVPLFLTEQYGIFDYVRSGFGVVLIVFGIITLRRARQS